MPRTTPKSPVVESDPTADQPTAESDRTAAPVPAASSPAVPGALAPQDASAEGAAAPEPDEHGRYRVRDLDTGHELTIHAAALPHGHFKVLAGQPASDELSGQPLPPVHAGTTESPVEPTTSGQEAENKEKFDA